ncbi:hypothetical protein LTR28_007365, partial [Elasticomyces elasticus]
MPSPVNMSRLRLVALYSSSTIAFLTSAITTALTTSFATTVLLRSPIGGQALAAAALDILGLGAFLIFTFAYTRKQEQTILWDRRRRWAFAAGPIILALLSAVLTIATLAWMASNYDRLHQKPSNRRKLALLGAAFAMWTISVIAQLVFYALLLTFSSSRSTTSSPQGSPSRQRTPPKQRTRAPSLPLESLRPPPAVGADSAPASPTLSSHAMSPPESFRNSMQQIIRPVTSRTRLLRKSFNNQDSKSMHSERPTSMDAVRQQDGFETWDISSVDPHVTDTVRQQTAKVSKLATIPGSRPVSPANPLDGPFCEAPAEETAQQQGAQHPPAQSTRSLHSTSIAILPPLTSRRPSAPDELHIHPLFRTDSPAPPPNAMPGTVVTASPYAGQIATASHPSSMPPSRPFLSLRLNSSQDNINNGGGRPISSSPLSPARSRPGSAK